MSNSKYRPRLNDYVKWKNDIEGWIYCVNKKYITIETHVVPKDKEDLQHSSLHLNKRLLILCYSDQWNELIQMGYREDKYSEDIIRKEHV